MIRKQVFTFRCFDKNRVFIKKDCPLQGVLMNLIQSLEQEIENFKLEYEKFERGNKSAGTRARKQLQNIKKISQDLRVLIQDTKKDEPDGDED